MTFKEARSLARQKFGTYIGVYEQKDRGWFVEDKIPCCWGCHPRAVFYVRRDGSMCLVNSNFARNYQKKYFASMQEKLDYWKPYWRENRTKKNKKRS